MGVAVNMRELLVCFLFHQVIGSEAQITMVTGRCQNKPDMKQSDANFTVPNLNDVSHMSRSQLMLQPNKNTSELLPSMKKPNISARSLPSVMPPMPEIVLRSYYDSNNGNEYDYNPSSYYGYGSYGNPSQYNNNGYGSQYGNTGGGRRNRMKKRLGRFGRKIKKGVRWVGKGIRNIRSRRRRQRGNNQSSTNYGQPTKYNG